MAFTPKNEGTAVSWYKSDCGLRTQPGNVLGLFLLFLDEFPFCTVNIFRPSLFKLSGLICHLRRWLSRHTDHIRFSLLLYLYGMITEAAKIDPLLQLWPIQICIPSALARI